ncbi:MAG: anti-sigma factor family protein [Armatimonadota bacterium]
MNCRQFANYTGEYVDRTLNDALVPEMEAHIKSCRECADLISELENASLAVRSLNRLTAPSGFDERLKARLTAQRETAVSSTVQGMLSAWVRSISEAIDSLPSTGRRLAVIPVLSGILLLVLMVGSYNTLVTNRNSASAVHDTDWAYIQTCREAHASFASVDPIADDAAAFLKVSASIPEQEL